MLKVMAASIPSTHEVLWPMLLEYVHKPVHHVTLEEEGLFVI